MDLERQLRPYRRARKNPRPVEGWLRAMRLAAGIPADRIADAMEFTPKMVFQTERSEQKRTISLEQLGRHGAGDGMRPGVRAGAVASVAGGSGDGACGAGVVEEAVYGEEGGGRGQKKQKTRRTAVRRDCDGCMRAAWAVAEFLSSADN